MDHAPTSVHWKRSPCGLISSGLKPNEGKMRLGSVAVAAHEADIKGQIFSQHSTVRREKEPWLFCALSIVGQQIFEALYFMRLCIENSLQLLYLIVT